MKQHLSLRTSNRRGAARLSLLLILGLGACDRPEFLSDDGAVNVQDLASAADLSTGAADLSGPARDLATADGASGDLGVTARCTSMSTWTQGNRRSLEMHPGMACITCHTAMKGPTFLVAGTVYPTLHEPDDCNGAPQGGPVTIEITDADGKVRTLTASTTSGNFRWSPIQGAIALPYSAVVKQGGRSSAMKTKQTSGDCNSCHTVAGANGAPGRITIP